MPRTVRDSFHYSRLLRSSSSSPQTLKQIHAQIITTGNSPNPFLSGKLVTLYSALGTAGVSSARNVFDRSPDRDVLLWNVMIRAYAVSGPPAEAVAFYSQMRRAAVGPNCYTYPFILKACAAAGDGRTGRAVHAHAVRFGLDSNLFAGNALLAFYARRGEIIIARKLFDEMTLKDVVSWNSMVAGYAQNDYADEAVGLLHRMLRDGRKPDHVTLVAVIPACTKLAAVQVGMWVHSYAVKTGMGVDATLGSGLIGLYASCGRLETARQLFDGIAGRNIFVYNSMMQAYGMHGFGSEALEVFSEMLGRGVRPDGVCFVSLLSACSHAGMVEKGFELFENMERHGVKKGEVHYACMVDLLGRWGELHRAWEFVKGMPVEAGKDVWGALLGACRMCNDLGLAEVAAERLFVLDPANAGRYMALASMYEDAGRQEDAAGVRKAMRDKGVRKPLGRSSVEVDSQAHASGIRRGMRCTLC